MQKVNIVIGRFQPFTTGHYKCVEAAWNQKGLPTVICMINVPESKLDLKHPFPSDTLVKLYGTLFKGNPKIAGVFPIQSADIVKAGQMLREFGFEIAAWTCGTDRYPDYSSKAVKYHDRAGLSDDFEMIVVDRDMDAIDNVSATKVRECLLNDDREKFLSMIPMSTSDGDILYDALQPYIYRIYGKTERMSRKFKNLTLEYRIARLERLLKYNR